MFKCRLILLFHSREYTQFLDSAEISTQELDMRLTCQAENHNVLTVSGFCTEEQAISYLEKLRIAFYWLMLDQGIVVDASLEQKDIQRHCNVRDECNFNSINGQSSTHIYEKEYPYIHTTYTGGGSALGASSVLSGLRRGLAIAARIIPEIDESLGLSLDLYRSSILQDNLRARFTMLISSMECLKLKCAERRDDWLIALLDRFIAEIKDHDLSPSQSINIDDVNAKKDSLIEGLKGLRNKPKKQLLLQELNQLYDDSKEFKRAKRIIKGSFAKRNRILHEGEGVSLEEVERLDVIQKDVLIHRISSLPKRRLFEDIF